MNNARIIQLLIGVNLAAGVWSLSIDGVTPSWVAYPVLVLVTTALLRRGERAASGYLALIAAVFTLMHLTFTREAVSSGCVHPANPDLACHPVTWIVTLGVAPAMTAVIACALFLRSRRTQAVPNHV